MDSRRFDSLTRSLAAPKSRRGFLGGLAALGAGLLGARASGAQVTQARCGNVVCYNRTTNTTTTQAPTSTTTTTQAPTTTTTTTQAQATTTTTTPVPVNQAPVVALNQSGAGSYVEGDPATFVAPSLIVLDDSGVLAGATVTLGATAQPGDILTATGTQSVSVSPGSGPFTVVLTGAATVDEYVAVLRTVTYRNTAADPNTATRTAGFQVTDTGGSTSNVATRDIVVTAV